MPDPVYDDVLTRESRDRLVRLVTDLPQPVTLAGGHAVWYVVRTAWRARFDQNYFGSRDIDICYFVDPSWNEEELGESAAGEAPDRIKQLGYEPSGMFRFVLWLDADGGILDEAPGLDMRPGVDYHGLKLDPMVTHQHPKLKDVLGFQPFAEPLLAHAFSNGELRTTVDELGPDVYIPRAPLLAATKLSSLPDRTKDDKAVKDLCDLYALVDFSDATVQEIRKTVHGLLDSPAENVNTALSHGQLEQALAHLDIPEADYRAVVGRLGAPP